MHWVIDTDTTTVGKLRVVRTAVIAHALFTYAHGPSTSPANMIGCGCGKKSNTDYVCVCAEGKRMERADISNIFLHFVCSSPFPASSLLIDFTVFIQLLV